jgi:hypothetical protein
MDSEVTRKKFDTRGFIGAAFLLFAALFVIGHCAGCAKRGDVDDNARRLSNAMTVEEYRRALDGCVAEGKDAGSMQVYSRCADEADKHYGAVK